MQCILPPLKTHVSSSVSIKLAPQIALKAGQIWCDQEYYLDQKTKQFQSKYVLTLAIADHGDIVHAVFTSKANGLTDKPACSTGIPRAGFYIGTIDKLFHKETWVDFSSIQILDYKDLQNHLNTKKKISIGETLNAKLFCEILRCAVQSEDITRRTKNYIYQAIAACGCS